MNVRTTFRPSLFNASCSFLAHAFLAVLYFACDVLHFGGSGAYLLDPEVMSCGTADKSGEMLRSLLILCSPTSVSDDTGDTDDVKVETIFSVGHPRFISAKEAPSSFRCFGAGGSGAGTNGADGRFLCIRV